MASTTNISRSTVNKSVVSRGASPAGHSFQGPPQRHGPPPVLLKGKPSRLPVWLCFFFWQLLCFGGVAAYIGLQHYYYKDALDWRILGGICGGWVVLQTILAHVIVGKRVGEFSRALQEDPVIIMGDMYAAEKLRQLPRCFGTKEIDTLQVSILHLFNTTVQEARKESGGLAVSTGRTFDQHSWVTADSYQSCEEGEEEWGEFEDYDGGGDSENSRLLSTPCRSFNSYTTGPPPQSPQSRAINNSQGVSPSAIPTNSPSQLTASEIAEDCRAVSMEAGSGNIGHDPTVADPLDDNHKEWDEIVRTAPDPGGSLFSQMLSQLKVGQDLTKVILPVHILEPISLLEKLSHLFVHPAVFAAIDDPDENVRMLNVVRWYMSSFHRRPKGAKKPYNPILGETFSCRYTQPDDPRCFIDFTAEQVSHHPPVSAFKATGCGATVRAVYYPRSKLVSLNCGASIGHGEIQLELPKYGEVYSMDWPTVYVGGAMVGTLRLELGGKVKFACRKNNRVGCRAELEFLRKGWVSGGYDFVKGKVVSPTNELVFRLQGKWNALVTYAYVGADDMARTPTIVNTAVENPALHMDESVLLDPRLFHACLPKARSVVGSTKQSRNVWHKVTTALRKQDPTTAQREKAKVEQIQRAERKMHADHGTTHQQLLYRFKGPAHEAKHLEKLANWEPTNE